MIENRVDTVRAVRPAGDWRQPGACVVKINVTGGAPTFEQVFLITFMKEFKVKFTLETYDVPTYRGCSFE